MMMLSLSTRTITLREGGDRIHPGLYFREDRVVRVGRDADPVTGEIHVVNIAVRIVAPERLRAGLVPVSRTALFLWAAASSTWAGSDVQFLWDNHMPKISFTTSP